MIGVAVIGFGYWGPKLARNFAALPGVDVVAIADLDEARRGAAKRDFPSARVGGDYQAAIDATDVDAVVVATQPLQHRPLAMAAIAAGKHVLVEKPCGAEFADAQAIAAAAQARGRTFMVDYTFVFAPAVEALATIVRRDLGKLIYIESTRTNLARFDASIGVVRDLAIHDLAILDHIIGCPASVVSTRNRRPPGEPEDFAFLMLDYDGVPAHIHVDCLSPVKIRRMTIGGVDGTVIYDDVEPVEKIRLYRRGQLPMADLRTGYRSGPVECPTIPPEEPLARLASHFVHCIVTGAAPITGAASALRVLATTDTVQARLNAEHAGR
jgi:predicted dehydrogenase